MIESNYLGNYYLAIFKGLDERIMDRINNDPNRTNAHNELQEHITSCRNRLSGWLDEQGVGSQISLGEPRVLNWLFLECPPELAELVSDYPDITSFTRCKKIR